jgi:prepilin-type processing-associated H-X9-DG protein
MQAADYNDIRVCPEATKPAPPWGNGRRPAHAAWFIQDARHGGQNMADWGHHLYDYGSYGVNRYVYNTPEIDARGGPVSDSIWSNPNRRLRNWKTTGHRGSANIPVVADCNWVGGNPSHIDRPLADVEGNMSHFAIDRHSGTINICFMDWSVRRVGIKCLWTLKWHRVFETCNAWTACGGVRESDWPAAWKKYKGCSDNP